MSKKRVACCFTGGKDSTLVLHLLAAKDASVAAAAQELGEALHQQRESADICLLVLFAPAGGPEFKAHPLDLIKLQAKAVGLPLEIVEISPEPTYLDGYRAAITALKEKHGISVLATGDILDVCSDFMARATQGIVELWRPLWGLPRPQLLSLLWRCSVEPTISCINLTKFIPGTPGDQLSGHCSTEDGTACHGSASKPQPPGGPGAGGVDGTAAGTVSADPAGGSQEPDPVRDVLGHVLSPDFHAEVLKGWCDRLGLDECGEHGEFHTQVLAAPMFRGQRLKLTFDRLCEGEFAFWKVLAAELVADG